MHLVLAAPALRFPSLPKMPLALEPGFALGKFTGSPDLQSGLARGCVKDVFKVPSYINPRYMVTWLWFLPPPCPGASRVTSWRGENPMLVLTLAWGCANPLPARGLRGSCRSADEGQAGTVVTSRLESKVRPN